MAEINVQRKGPSIWPWIIGLIVLGLLIWGLTEVFDSDADDAAAVEEVGLAAPPSAGPAPLLAAA